MLCGSWVTELMLATGGIWVDFGALGAELEYGNQERPAIARRSVLPASSSATPASWELQTTVSEVYRREMHNFRAQVQERVSAVARSRDRHPSSRHPAHVRRITEIVEKPSDHGSASPSRLYCY